MLIATDLDGTFLSPDATVSPRNRAAVEAAEAAGIRVVPVTGRAIGGLRIIGPVFHQHALVCNGAVGGLQRCRRDRHVHRRDPLHRDDVGPYCEVLR
ncbi:hypothetical protein HMPREF9622_02729 [Cutibacterium modestum HL037PA3]|nr:hypothetical protein HMPREF9622_02729 [Cutibacterium modestum HL037PA3]